MEKLINEFLESEYTIRAFCKLNDLNQKDFEKLFYSLGYTKSISRKGFKFKAYKEAIEDYTQSLDGVRACALRHNVDAQTLTKELKELNLFDESKKGKAKKNYNERVFDIIDTEEKAYWLGFIYADGYIYHTPLDKSKKRIDYNFELCAAEIDLKHMQKFAKFMEYNKVLKVTKADNKGHNRVRICLSSQHLWETLNSYGCTPQKSLTLQFPDESIFIESEKYTKEELIRHFIRGYWDGDGCLSWRNKEHTIPDISVLGTESMLEGIKNHVIELSNNKLYLNHKNNEITKLISCSSRKAFKTCKYLYSNATIYLDRKYEKYLKYCRLYEESYRELQTKIGESCDANPEVIIETKESVTP